MEIDHKDSNRGNNRPSNLRYVTSAHNIQHSVARGHRGENRWNAKLNPSKVRLIREMKANGIKVKHIAQEIGVSTGAVYHVLRGHNWKHV
jgi:hypothetical protein